MTTFRKPTIKADGRACVRLYSYFNTPEKWIAFLERHHVERIPFGMARNGDCAIRVVDRASGILAALGPDIPCVIKYHVNIHPDRQFWTEEFATSTEVRSRVTEVGGKVLSDGPLF